MMRRVTSLSDQLADHQEAREELLLVVETERQALRYARDRLTMLAFSLPLDDPRQEGLGAAVALLKEMERR